MEVEKENNIPPLEDEQQHEMMTSSNDELVEVVRDNHLFSLPSVEQMQRDVANVTCELQRAYIPRKKVHSESLEGRNGNVLLEPSADRNDVHYHIIV